MDEASCSCHLDFVKGVLTGLFSGLAGGVVISGLGAWLYEKTLGRQLFSSLPHQDETYRLRRGPISDRQLG